MPLRLILTVLISSLIFCPQPAHCELEYDPGLPFSWLFDTKSASAAPISVGGLAQKDGWKLVGEEALEHVFGGDAVLLNDRLAVVLRAQGPGAEVYSLSDGRLVNRAVLAAVPDADAPISVTGLSSLAILENSPASVKIEATFKTSVLGKTSSAVFGITAGQRMVQMCPAAGAARLFAWYRPDWIVVPDFFGHDMVFNPRTVTSTRFGLPAENFVLGLIRGRGAMMMCVWESGRRRSHLIPPGKAADQTVAGSEIEGLEGEPVWFAFFEGPDLWYQADLAEGDVGDTVSLDFRPPFKGRWRADLAWPDGVAHSCPFSNSTVALDDVEKPDPPRIIVYPLDRTRETPLSAFCPTDVIRHALGVGPCQYILQTEGLATETNPTPDQVMTWVERQFQRDTTEETADEIKELLTQMVQHIGHAQARIDRYAEFSREVDQLLKNDQAARSNKPGESPLDPASLAHTAARLRKVVPGNQTDQLGKRAPALAREVIELIGKPDALQECRRVGHELRLIGAQQDGTLSRSRMIVRWLNEQASTLAADHTEFARLSGTVREACLRQLDSR